MNYNPYDLVPISVNGKPINGRPIELDSDIVNQKTLVNAFGKLVKPSKVMTMCPDCGAGFQLSVNLGDPPFQTIVATCPQCRPAPSPLVDPFVNPVTTGRIQAFELDPLQHDPNQALPIFNEPVVERFEIPSSGITKIEKIDEDAARAKRIEQAKKARKEKKKAIKPKPQPQQPESIKLPVDDFTLSSHSHSLIEKADGLAEECDFDDSDMIEDL